MAKGLMDLLYQREIEPIRHLLMLGLHHLHGILHQPRARFLILRSRTSRLLSKICELLSKSIDGVDGSMAVKLDGGAEDGGKRSVGHHGFCELGLEVMKLLTVEDLWCLF